MMLDSPRLALIGILLFMVFLVSVSSLIIIAFLIWDITQLTFKKNCFYLPAKKETIRKIMRELRDKNPAYFYDLGCGDGRVLREAEKFFPKTEIIGYEINPLLCLWNRLIKKLPNSKIEVRRKNLFTAEIKPDSIVYFFLLPEMIGRLNPKLEDLKNVTIVSHGFDIKYLETRLWKAIEGKPFKTYIYRV